MDDVEQGGEVDGLAVGAKADGAHDERRLAEGTLRIVLPIKGRYLSAALRLRAFLSVAGYFSYAIRTKHGVFSLKSALQVTDNLSARLVISTLEVYHRS